MKEKQPCLLISQLSGFFMLLMLAWLTVCLPYVNEARQTLQVEVQLAGDDVADTDDSSLPVNTNEEKSESGISLLAEYLHHILEIDHTFFSLVLLHKSPASSLYLAFHPELIIPPPEA